MKRADFRSLLSPNFTEESRAPAAVSGRELQELISPISCEEFANSYFSRKSLSVPGTPNKFEHIFSWEKLRQALARGQRIPDKRYNIMASFTGGEESGSSRRMFEAHYNQLDELYQAGATICITNIHMADPFLARWAQAIRSQLNFTGTVGVNCYVSPHGSGLPTHYDRRVATSIQIAGKKRWRYSTESAKAWPSHNALYQKEHIEPVGVDPGKLPHDMEFHEVELNPGDLLCLPAGAWHSACGVGESLALNLYFAPRNFLEQLIPLLQDFAASDANWRAGPPATVEAVQGSMPKAISTYMRERLDEFHKIASEVIDGPDALAENWLDFVARNPYTGWLPAPKSPLRPMTAEQRFRVAMPPLNFVQSQDQVMLMCDNGTLKFPAAAAPILRRLSSELSGFTIRDVLAWREKPNEPSPNDAVLFLQTLYENGIVEMVG